MSRYSSKRVLWVGIWLLLCHLGLVGCGKFGGQDASKDAAKSNASSSTPAAATAAPNVAGNWLLGKWASKGKEGNGLSLGEIEFTSNHLLLAGGASAVTYQVNGNTITITQPNAPVITCTRVDDNTVEFRSSIANRTLVRTGPARAEPTAPAGPVPDRAIVLLDAMKKNDIKTLAEQPFRNNWWVEKTQHSDPAQRRSQEEVEKEAERELLQSGAAVYADLIRWMRHDCEYKTIDSNEHPDSSYGILMTKSVEIDYKKMDDSPPLDAGLAKSVVLTVSFSVKPDDDDPLGPPFAKYLSAAVDPARTKMWDNVPMHIAMVKENLASPGKVSALTVMGMSGKAPMTIVVASDTGVIGKAQAQSFGQPTQIPLDPVVDISQKKPAVLKILVTDSAGAVDAVSMDAQPMPLYLSPEYTKDGWRSTFLSPILADVPMGAGHFEDFTKINAAEVQKLITK